MECITPPLKGSVIWRSRGDHSASWGTRRKQSYGSCKMRNANQNSSRNLTVCAANSKGDSPGEYGGPPVDMRIRKTWGTNDPDPLTNPDSYIWNKKWKEALDFEERQEAEAAQLEEERKQKAKEGDSGFLSLGRSLALNSMEVDLSAELSQPSPATLERQLAQSRQGEMRRQQQLHEEGLKWRVAPTRGEEKQWATANRYIGERGIAEGGKQSLTPEENAKEAEVKFQKLKSDLFLYTLGIGGACLVGAYVAYTPDVALSYFFGSLGALAYIRMLTNSVAAIGSTSVASAALGAAGQPRLLVPLVLVLVFNRWNGLFAEDYHLPPLQLIPMLIGFFTYKAATLVQTFVDILEPMAPKKIS